MWVVVYQLRRAGQKLPQEIVRARPAVGYLYFGADPRKAYPSEVIRLFKAPTGEQDVIEPMVYPALKKIERGGMLFRGSEEVRSATTQPQVWWVLPGPLDDLTAGNAYP